jgi:hypothetical protein
MRAYGSLQHAVAHPAKNMQGRLPAVSPYSKLGVHRMSFSTMIKKPSAFLPIAMSLAALATVLLFLAMFGVVHETDEGAAAHIWQLLMGLQIPIIVFFAIKWLVRAPRQALYVLALQAGAALAALAPVYFLKL